MPAPPRIRLYVGISTVFVVLTVAIVGIVVWNTHRETQITALDNADRLFQQVTTRVADRITSRLDSLSAVTDTLASVPGLSRRPAYDGLDHPGVPLLMEVLESRPQAYGFSLGFGDGSYLQVTPPRGNPRILDALKAPIETAHVIRSMTYDIDGHRREYLRYVDSEHRLIGARTERLPQFDPRRRPWYALGLDSDHPMLAGPHVFVSLQQPGFTLSRRMRHGGVIVVGATLEGFSEFLAEQQFVERSSLFAFDRQGHLLAHPDASLVAMIAEPGENSGQRSLANVRNSENDLVRSIGAAYLDDTDNGEGIHSLDVAGERQLYTVRPVQVSADSELLVAVSAPLVNFTAPFSFIQQRNLVFALIVLTGSVPIIILLARRIARKLAALEEEAVKIQRFDLAEPVNVDSRFREIHSLSVAFGAMKGSVETFGRYVPKSLVREILDAGGNAEPGGQHRELTLMFTDIADFTELSETMDPGALALQISTYFEAIAKAVARHSGVVDKYVGDAVMALWNAPRPDTEHVLHACTAALVCRRVVEALNADWRASGQAPMHTRFGLHTGLAVVGNVGGTERMNYTAMGASVNVASRLEGLNKVYGTQILVSDAVQARVGEQLLLREIDRASPKGSRKPIGVFELMGATPGRSEIPKNLWANESQLALAAAWTPAYLCYAARDWHAASAAFEGIAQRFPNDRPAEILAERCRRFESEPPPDSWDGVTRHQRK